MRSREFLSLSEAKVKEKYLDAINTVLQTATDLPLEPETKKYPGIVNFVPDPGQQLSTIKDTLTGTINGEQVTVPGTWIHKSDFIKNTQLGKSSNALVVNQGEVAEGFHATAAFARLIKRPSEPITIDDVIGLIPRLGNNTPLVLTKNEVSSKIADEFHLTIALKPGTWKAFKDPRTVELMGKILDSILVDANAETSRFADRFASNQRFDVVKVVGDGVSEETTKKTDIRFENEAEKKFADYSIKVGTTKQIHQVGGGAISGNRALPPEQRFDILQNTLFNGEGRFHLADISAAKDKFVKAKTPLEGQIIAYQAAVASLNQNLQSDDAEKNFLKNLIVALKYWIGRDDPDVKLKQFTEKGILILDAHKIDQLYELTNIDLVAEYNPTKTVPRITIKDQVSGKALVTIRTKQSESGYVRNYVEKEDLFVDLTQIKNIPNAATAAKPVKVAPTAPAATAPALGPNTTTMKGTAMKSAVPASIANQNRTLGNKIPMGSAPDPTMPQ
jgi:hypothetical protein